VRCCAASNAIAEWRLECLSDHLDRLSTTLPAAVHHRGGHTRFYNSKALQMAGITRDTPQVPGHL